MEDLFTDRLILRTWKEEDYEDLYEYAKSELVGPNAGWMPHKDEDESKKIIKIFIKNNETYAIVLKSENKVIGSIGLHDRKPDNNLLKLNQKEVGYVLNPRYWGKEIVPEAVKSLVDYGFNKLNLELIWCAHFDFNNNSKRVIEKCGFKYKFKKLERLKLLNNKEVTTLYYCIFRTEYKNNLRISPNIMNLHDSDYNKMSKELLE
ncbi:GNAT family N-acetyltransferase [Clostridium beijerinckii]|uniref:GNAT family N-acetyltransferase n=1 Tax=Clostridium beijerinckii TaxID=1520 RepID=UPI00232ECEBE|nr:GNAT family N-acetyltransferase [Clostridium beijerinckii]